MKRLYKNVMRLPIISATSDTLESMCIYVTHLIYNVSPSPNIVQNYSVDSDPMFVCVLWLPSIIIKTQPLSALMSPCVDSTGCTYISLCWRKCRSYCSAYLPSAVNLLWEASLFSACFNVTQYQVPPSDNSLDNNTHYGSITMVMFALLHSVSPVWGMLLIYFYEIILQY